MRKHLSIRVLIMVLVGWLVVAFAMSACRPAVPTAAPTYQVIELPTELPATQTA